jgi:hypothetical protein
MFVKSLPSRPRRYYQRGTGFADVFLTVAVMSATCGVALQQVSGVRRGTEELNRNEAVKMLNNSLAAYLDNGGSIPAGASGDTVLSRMKKSAAEVTEGTFVGVKGPFVDARLKTSGSPQTNQPRIVWDSGKQKFAVASEGAGWSRVYYDDAEGLQDHGTETRKYLHQFASESCWVWDYSDAGTGQRGPLRVGVADPSVGQLPLLDDPVPLGPPVINPSSGVFNHHDFPLSLTITNGNVPNSSEVLYQINGGAWQVWQGGQEPLEKSLTTTVTAYAQAREMNGYIDSDPVTETYISYFMRGQGAGVFMTQTGESQFLYDLTQNGTNLSWGKTESAGQAVSSLELLPGSVFEAGEGESFELGKLRYTNGVTRAGTNAKTATVRLDLSLSVPATGTLSVDLPVRMLNTIHYPWTAENEHSDFLWVPQYTSLSQTITILDRQFAVSILAQADSAVVEGSEIKVPIGEGVSADVTLIATVTALD